MGIFNRDRHRSTADLAAEYADTATRSVRLVKETGPAVSRTIVEQRGGINMTKKFDKAGISLSKAGLDGIRAEAVMILDHSGSMSPGYRSGMVSTLVARALAFALHIDRDGRIPVIPFDSRLWPEVDVTLSNYADIVDQRIYRPGQMGGTYLAPALYQVLRMAETTEVPLYVVIVTDDDPSDRTAVISTIKELKRYPVFLKVLTLEDAPFWDSMDDMVVPGLIDNLDAKRVADPANMADLAFADVMVDEWHSWIDAATAAGILLPA